MIKKVIVSAVNSFGGGQLAIVQDCLRAMKNFYPNDVEIIALVYDKSLVEIAGITYFEFPKARSKWFWRLYYEYFYFKKLSIKLQPDLWFSLADATPNVVAPIRAVYCHNLAPFYKITGQDARFDPVLAIYHYFFKYIYQINVHKNKYVIVQQEWLRDEFERRLNIKNVLVAKPNISVEFPKSELSKQTNKTIFFYPSIPRVFKNYEIIIEAIKILLTQKTEDFEVVFTFDGTENPYSKSIKNNYKDIKQLRFVGELSRKVIFEYYQKADCILFPSKIETWGLGISEAINFEKPVITIDAPYAHETAENYDKIKFFKPNSADSLAQYMREFMEKTLVFDKNEVIIQKNLSLEIGTSCCVF